MMLSVRLIDPATRQTPQEPPPVRQRGPLRLLRAPTPDVYWQAELTHNLGPMAVHCNLYQEIWWPEELGLERAKQLIRKLQQGLAWLQSDPAFFRNFEHPNGYGTYEDFVTFVAQYAAACRRYPTARVQVRRGPHLIQQRIRYHREF